MKHLKLLRFFLITLLLSAFPLTASAFIVNGLAYGINDDNTSVTVSAGDNCFGDIIIPESVTYDGTTYSVTAIGDYGFSSCVGLTSIYIPNTVKSIGLWAFRSCGDLASITIPNSVNYIGYQAFRYCNGLTSVTSLIEDPSSVTLSDDIFYDVDLQQCILYVPKGKIQEYRNAEQWCRFGRIIDTNDFSDFITFADSEVERICVNNWDANGDGFLSYTEAANVTSLGGVFSHNQSISSFDELQYFVGITSIGKSEFDDCWWLTSINIPNSVTSIGDRAFYRCTDMTSINIPNSIVSIGSYAFMYCGFTSITIPNSVTSIGEYAFAGCYDLESVVVDNENLTYDSRNRCNAIIETASNTLIVGCKNTTIPNSVTTIGLGAFYECSITSLIIPNSVTSMGTSAFYGCSGLTSVTIPNSVTYIGESAFSGCRGLTSVTIPNSVTSIGGSAFSDCSGLTSITLTGQGAWSLKSNMPKINQLNTVNIGSGITSLGDFGFVPNVVNCYADVPPTCSSSTFASYDGALHVSKTATVAYMTANYWQNFTNLNNDLTEKVILNPSNTSLVQHEEMQLTATATPNGSTLIWSSTNQNVATVDDNGKVSAIDQGECDIYATLATNPAVYDYCHVTVSYPEITSLKLSETNLVFNQVNDTITLKVFTTPANSGPKPIWTSSDETIASVDINGLVTAMNLGECDITASVLNQSATCHVIVTSAIVITLDIQSVTIKPNDIIVLTPSFNPQETDIVATSSNANVAFARAIIQDGIKKVQVVGLARGIATITVASVDGKAIPAICVVTVVDDTGVLIGDVNGDGRVNVSDVSTLINMILGITEKDETAADVNGDGRVNVSDVSALINIILGIQ